MGSETQNHEKRILSKTRWRRVWESFLVVFAARALLGPSTKERLKKLSRQTNFSGSDSKKNFNFLVVFPHIEFQRVSRVSAPPDSTLPAVVVLLVLSIYWVSRSFTKHRTKFPSPLNNDIPIEWVNFMNWNRKCCHVDVQRKLFRK